MMNTKLQSLCDTLGLGRMTEPPQRISGGLLHRMYRVCTDRGNYAVKALNPDIMARPEAPQNMIRSEQIAHALRNTVPLAAALTYDGQALLLGDSDYYLIYPWLEGRSVFPPEITADHCRKIGALLGKIHAADVQIPGMEQEDAPRMPYPWSSLLHTAEQSHPACAALLKDRLDTLCRWDERALTAQRILAGRQVISHRDLDPKNVLWHCGQPCIIDWEAAGWVNPQQELMEVIQYWTGGSPMMLRALMKGYTCADVPFSAPWAIVLDASRDGMLGWLHYNLRRALGLEGSTAADREEGLQQTALTLEELEQHAAHAPQLEGWLQQYEQQET